MDVLSLLRTLGGLGIVLGLLAGALWTVRRYDIKLPGQIGGGAVRRLELVERLAIDGKRSVALIRRDGREHLVLFDPAGSVVIEAGVDREHVREAAADAQEPAEPLSDKDGRFGSWRLKAPATAGQTGEPAIDDMLPFHEALARIQEKSRRARETLDAPPRHDEMDNRIDA